MYIKNSLLILIAFIFLGCKHSTDTFIVKGQMPDIVTGNNLLVHMVYGSGDSILYLNSADGGKSFSTPRLVAVLSGLAASHSRGPQIAVTDSGLIITACQKDGDIYSYTKKGEKTWEGPTRINDTMNIAKENLMDLAAEGQDAFALWLDLRSGHNQLYGAYSKDGGKTWSPNRLVYASPDSMVCSCCKPSVAFRNKKIYVMFRNWLQGNRDMYLAEGSLNNWFGEPHKLGRGSWKLDGCPMDGGGLVVDDKNVVATTWQRKGSIYAAAVSGEEQELGKGNHCSMASVNGEKVYTWSENGEVVVQLPGEKKKQLGKGSRPVIAATGHKIICIWDNEEGIQGSVLEL